MAATIHPTVPVARPEAEPWPTNEHSIRVDEMFARQLDTEFSAGVRGLLHDPETGLSALKGDGMQVGIDLSPLDTARIFRHLPDFPTRRCRETAGEKPCRSEA